MKYVATIDMDAVKAEALGQVDEVFRSKRNQIRGANADIHDAKYRESTSSGDRPLLRKEAEVKGLDVEELAKEVWNRGQETIFRLSELESRRQTAQAKIRAATSPAEVSKILKGVL